MCRLFLSYGYNKHTKQNIERFFRQSSHTKKHTPGQDNPRDLLRHQDGFGLAWMKDAEWHIYKQPVLYTEDPGFASRLHRIPKEIVLGHLRNNQTPMAGKRHENNTHPFLHEKQVLMHNGYIGQYQKHRSTLLTYIDPEYKNQIRGETDTEILFYMLLSIIKRKYKKKPNMKQVGISFQTLFHIFF